MSILVLIYILNYIDRNNAAAARLRGFEEDLHLEGTQFASILSILYVGYISMQIPSNMFLNHIGKPSLYLPVCMVVWGLLSILTGKLTTSFYGALTTRFLLGIVEASFFPGALFLISKWYKHSELGFRTALLFCGNIISNAFGSLIASAILDTMEGVLGQSAWRWLFFVEGSLTVVVAILAIFVLPDFPETTHPGWLTQKEIRLAILRLEEDSDQSEESDEKNSHLAGFVAAMKDPHMYILTGIMLSQILAQTFNMYFPTLTATLGYSRTITLLLCAPPFLLSAVLTFLNSRHSDMTGERFYHITVPFAVGIVGFAIATQTMNVGWRYFALFLMAQTYAGFSIFYGWMSNTFPSPHTKRAVALAFCNSVSQIGNIGGSYIWPSGWGPTYRKSFAICIVASSCSILMCYLLKLRLQALNRKILREERERGETSVGFRYLH
ncbi:major facilitator superfamily domain-containing protein [Irpex lacteus]|nr:major facilitator superfamily domain-containing protein [Irpex lacteus]